MERRGVRRTVLALALVQILVASGALGYRWVTTSPEATVEDALAQYRQHRPEVTPTPGTTPTPDHDVTADPTPTPLTDAPTEPEPEETEAEPEASDDTEPASPPLALVTQPPEPGVYEWDTDGWEQAAGIRRDLPERSVRIITHEGPQRWMNEHRYSEDHVQWFPFDLTEQGVFCEEMRNRVRFGPLGGENTIPYDPPARFTAFPLEVGTTWTGSWDGDTHGTYQGRIFEQTSLRIGGEDVDVWGTELRMEMDGELTGTVEVKTWLSIEHRMTVRETYDQQVTTDRGTYRGEWTITLTSTQPQQ